MKILYFLFLAIWALVPYVASAKDQDPPQTVAPPLKKQRDHQRSRRQGLNRVLIKRSPLVRKRKIKKLKRLPFIVSSLLSPAQNVLSALSECLRR